MEDGEFVGIYQKFLNIVFCTSGCEHPHPQGHEHIWRMVTGYWGYKSRLEPSQGYAFHNNVILLRFSCPKGWIFLIMKTSFISGQEEERIQLGEEEQEMAGIIELDPRLVGPLAA